MAYVTVMGLYDRIKGHEAAVHQRRNPHYLSDMPAPDEHIAPARFT